MDTFISRKRRRPSVSNKVPPRDPKCDIHSLTDFNEEESTDYKLSILISLHPEKDQETLLESLLASDGSVERTLECLKLPAKKRPTGSATSYQSSLSSITRTGKDRAAAKPLTKKGKTIHLYTPEDIEAHTPCSIIYNFLPPEEADALLQELLDESPTYRKNTFQLFDRVVSSPHTFCLYVNSWGEAEMQKTQYIYDGEKVKDVRRSLPRMRDASYKVRETVNQEITRRIRSSPTGQKLQHQSPAPWAPNTAFVNCYDGPRESVGYHSDHLTYLGPRPVIGSLSLGVAREFRIRKIVATDDDAGDSADSDEARKRADAKADAQGQLSIHLPHNSLLVMHASMQEEWKHSIAPARTISPHPISGNKRINITYRHYKANLHPRFTPKCGCGVPTVLRVVQRQAGNRGKYMWMCYAGYVPGKEGCKFFEWAVFDEDGDPPWAEEAKNDERQSSGDGEKCPGDNEEDHPADGEGGKEGALGPVDEG
ncbi:hypothetical protein VE03_02372 [Pseudogymnoascus sp. 23342-1-I1]|nr:hypothetical protein VE03_02372 [Pseudogymnoascus sp. 23342-1-I1]